MEEPEVLEAFAKHPEQADIAQHAGRKAVRKVDIVVGEQLLRMDLDAAITVLRTGIAAGRELRARLSAGLEAPVRQQHPLQAVRIAVFTGRETGIGFHTSWTLELCGRFALPVLVSC